MVVGFFGEPTALAHKFENHRYINMCVYGLTVRESMLVLGNINSSCIFVFQYRNGRWIEIFR
jgi:hypothetical protein